MIGENDLPHIAVIDSRTGARILTVKGFLSPGDLAMALLEFLDSNSFDDTRAPRIRNIDTTRDVDRLHYSSEGHHTWTLDEVQSFESRWPIGTKARRRRSSSSSIAGWPCCRQLHSFASVLSRM
jgi:hypothetical protein